MTKKGEAYVCEICVNKVQVSEADIGTLGCCGQDMKLVQRPLNTNGGRRKSANVDSSRF